MKCPIIALPIISEKIDNIHPASLPIIIKLIRHINNQNDTYEASELLIKTIESLLIDNYYLEANELIQSFSDLIKSSYDDESSDYTYEIPYLFNNSLSLKTFTSLYHSLKSIGIELDFDDFQLMFDQMSQSIWEASGEYIADSFVSAAIFYQNVEKLFTRELDTSEMYEPYETVFKQYLENKFFKPTEDWNWGIFC